MKNYTFGKWQSDLDIHDCLEGIFKFLRLDPSIALMQQPEIYQMLTTGEAPTRWSRPRHFSDPEGGHRVDIPTACGAWYSGNNHFGTFYHCADYWSILDPLSDLTGPPRRMQHKLHRALRESFHARNLPVPPLSPFIQLPRIAIHNDAPRTLWSCGTIAMCTTLHLLLGDKQTHELPTMYVSRDHMLSLHKALLALLITCSPPALWEIDCLHRDILPPHSAHTGPYAPISVAATVALPKGAQWRPQSPKRVTGDVPFTTLPGQHTEAHTFAGEINPPCGDHRQPHHRNHSFVHNEAIVDHPERCIGKSHPNPGTTSQHTS
jgi:hypothetical protein